MAAKYSLAPLGNLVVKVLLIVEIVQPFEVGRCTHVTTPEAHRSELLSGKIE